MAQAQGTVVFNNFVKGLITDSSDYNSDPTSAKDMSNFVITQKGTIEKRLGLEIYSTLPSLKTLHGDSPHIQRMVTYDGKKWIVISSNKSITVLNEASYNIEYTQTETISTPYQINVSVNDRFILYTFGINNVRYIEYADGIFSLGPLVDIKIRDFEGLDDGYDNDFRPSTLTDYHKYNLENQGWGNTFPYQTPYISYDEEGFASIRYQVVTGFDYEFFKASIGTYPSNADIAAIGIYQDPNDGGNKKFRPKNIVNTYVGNARAPMGSKILKVSDTFPRTLDDGSPLQIGEVVSQFVKGLACSTFFAGRVFYGTDNSIYFSQTLGRDARKLGACYQEADPTSEEISDLVDTDGGAITISGASGIFKLIEVGRNLLIFANNGIWALSGGEFAFKATEYIVHKVSEYTALNADVVFEIPGSIVFISQSGIMMVANDQVTLSPTVSNITSGRIQELFNSFGADVLINARITYSPKRNIVSFLIGDVLLSLDATVQAWYKYDLPPNSVALYTPDEEQVITEDTAITHLGADVTYNTELVTYSSDLITSIVSQVMVVYSLEGTDYSFATFSNTDYIDFQGTVYESQYSSFFVTHALTFDNAVLKKRLNQLSCFFTKTEIGYEENLEGGLEYLSPSSCTMQVGWDMPTPSSFTADTSNKWSREYQVYRLSRYEAKSLGEVPSEGLESILTRTSIRGTGRSLSLRFSSPSGYDCRLLGWSLDISTNTRTK